MSNWAPSTYFIVLNHFVGAPGQGILFDAKSQWFKSAPYARPNNKGSGLKIKLVYLSVVVKLVSSGISSSECRATYRK